MTEIAPRDGVGPSTVSLPSGTWPTLLDFLSERFAGVSRAQWAARLQAGAVLSSRGDALGLNAPYQSHTKVHYFRSVLAEPAIAQQEQVLYQDAHLVVADKPHFLPVAPTGRYVQETLLVRLKRRLGIDDLVPLHRIDRDTAGVVLFGVQSAERSAYHGLFLQQQVTKRYEAIAPWRAGLALPLTHRSRLVSAPHFLQMQEVPGPANSETRISLLAQHGPLARYLLEPRTGKRHQLRVHMSALGLPIVGDAIYPALTPQKLSFTAEDYARPLQLLAKAIAFTDPVTGEAREFVSQRALSWERGSAPTCIEK